MLALPLGRCLRLQAVPGSAAVQQKMDIFDLISKERQFDPYLRVHSVQKIEKEGIPADPKEVFSSRGAGPPFQQILQLLNTNCAATSTMMIGVLDLLEQLGDLANAPLWRFFGSSCKLLWSLLLVGLMRSNVANLPAVISEADPGLLVVLQVEKYVLSWCINICDASAV